MRAILLAALLALNASLAGAEAWIEPSMRMLPDRGPPTIALTFDACGGRADARIIDVLVAERIPATIFISGTWLRRNSATLVRLLDHRELFQIENHGHRHLSPSARDKSVYGLKAAASAEAVISEIESGRRDILAATGRQPQWYRGAAATLHPHRP